MIPSLLALVIILVTVGLFLAYVPLEPRIRSIIIAVVAVVTLVIVLRWFVPEAGL